jgi:hypothetical protein
MSFTETQVAGMSAVIKILSPCPPLTEAEAAVMGAISGTDLVVGYQIAFLRVRVILL